VSWDVWVVDPDALQMVLDVASRLLRGEGRQRIGQDTRWRIASKGRYASQWRSSGWPARTTANGAVVSSAKLSKNRSSCRSRGVSRWASSSARTGRRPCWVTFGSGAVARNFGRHYWTPLDDHQRCGRAIKRLRLAARRWETRAVVW